MLNHLADFLVLLKTKKSPKQKNREDGKIAKTEKSRSQKNREARGAPRIAVLLIVNEKRSSKIFEEFAIVLIEQARKSYYRNDFEVKVEGNVYALDSTTIDLCLNVFWWAEFRKAKGGIKIHTLYDVKTSIPSFLHISNASLHDVNVLDIIIFF